LRKEGAADIAHADALATETAVLVELGVLEEVVEKDQADEGG
jgi:hypothetical protein